MVPLKNSYLLSELWTGEELGKQHGSSSITIPGHGARILVGKSSGSEQPLTRTANHWLTDLARVDNIAILFETAFFADLRRIE